MNIKIVYASMTGHSKKIANAIAERLDDASAYDIKTEPCEPMNEDLLIIVSGIYSGIIKPEMKNWLEELDENQISSAAIIMSSVTQSYEKAEIKPILESKGINIAGEYSCQGSFLFMKFGHPKKDEIKAAADFAEELTKSLCEKCAD